MKNESILNERLYSEISAAVVEAGKIMLSPDFDVTQKTSSENIVTSSDVAVQNFLKEKLQKLVPECSFLCEEDDVHTLSSPYVFIIDPIDGTTNFSRGEPDCAISVALSYENEIVFGIVHCVFKGETFTAVKGEGAYLNGRRIRVSDKQFSDGLFCTAMSVYRKSLAPVCFDIINDVYYQSNDVRRFGSCAIELCYIAAGRCDLYFELRIYPWDYAAAYLILTEAGGVLTALGGKKLTFDKTTVLIGANSRENHEKLTAIVGKYLSTEPYDDKL